MTLVAGYATLIGQQYFQLAIFNGQKLFHLFDPIFQPKKITITIIEYGTIGPITGVLTLFLFFINLVAMGLVFSLTIWQTRLISKGQTCVEEKINKSANNNGQQRSIYDLGWKQNWRRFFQVETTTSLLVCLLVPGRLTPKFDETRWMLKSDE
jgi:hypothetical protein